MSSDFNPLLWFVCKICRQVFPDTEKLKNHKIRKHAEECRNVKCILFEERFFDKQWIPSDNYFPASNSELKNENLIEVAPLTSKCGCHCHSISAVSVSVETQTESYLQPPKHKPNPYVLVKRMTLTELNAAKNRSSEKLIFQSSCGSKETEQANKNICLNPEDVQSPNKTKDFSQHQEDQDQQQDLYADQSILVSPPPELVQNSVAPMVEHNTGLSPDAHFGPRSCASPLCSQKIASVQNPEEKEFQEAISFTLLEGEIHIELLSVIKEIQPETEPPVPANQLVPKTECHRRSTVSAEMHINKVAHIPSKPSSNPYVLVRRLTFEQLNAPLNQNLEKTVTESVSRSRGRKRTEWFKNYDDLPPIKKKGYLQQQDQEPEFHAGGNLSVLTPELMQEIVAPKAELSRDILLEQEQFSSIYTLSDSSVNAPSEIKYVANIQNLEDSDEQLPTGTQTLEYQEQHSKRIGSSINKNIWRNRSDASSIDTSTLAQPSLFNFSSLNKAEVNDDNENLSETNNTERILIISDVYSQASFTQDIYPSDSECFEMENPISPELSDEVEFVEEQNLPASAVVSEIGDAGNDSQRIQETEISQFEDQQHPIVELNATTVGTSSNACPILFNSDINAALQKPEEPLSASESEQPRYSTRAKRKKPQINYSESYLCSECNLDFDSFDDLLDHQKLCTKHRRVDAVSRRDKSSRQVCQISSSKNSSKVAKSTSNVTDGDSDYAAAEDKDSSDSESDHCIKAVEVPRVKLSKRKALPSATAPQNQLPIKAARGRNLALFKWLDTQKGARFSDGSKNKIYLSTERFRSTKCLGAKNLIKCKLCKINLTTEFQLINHVKNCWLHNQRNHRYCVPCEKSFENPQSLAHHFQENEKLLKHLRCKRKNGPHKLQSNGDEVHLDEDDYQMRMSVSDSDPHATAPVSSPSDKDLPLLQWLKIQHHNPNNVVALELDPFKSKSKSIAATFAVSESSPIRCKLCLQLLTSDVLLRNHVETCWSQNKAKHRYCVPCLKYFTSNLKLRAHQLFKHKNIVYQKHKQILSWFCTVCGKDMENESLFNAHHESLQIFLGNSSKTESLDFLSEAMSTVDSNQAQYVDIPGQERTMKNLLEWLKHIRKIPNSEGTANLVLIDPDPTTYSVGDEIEISEENPITCRLCLKKLTHVEDVKNHVKMCWSQNKENHRYCLSCDKGFATPTELQEHRTSGHSAPKNIVLFYREADGGQSLLNVDGLEVNSDNPVTCKLCETELTSTPEVKIHGDNCWFHNKAFHVYCTICDRAFDYLRAHNKKLHRNSPSCRSVEDKGESETETEELLPLEQWLKIQKENPKNVIALEPDNFVSETVNESSPVKCKLCQHLLTTESALRNHVKTCWTQNKAKHCYCLSCDSVFPKNSHLLKHNTAKHPKYPAILFTCLSCNQEFSTKSELTKHSESLQKFCRQRKQFKNPAKKVNSGVIRSGCHTVAYLFQRLQRLRQIKNIDGTENVILVDPEPTVDNFEEVDSENPITCRLCQQKFNTARRVHFHVRDCWTQKREMHRFCVTCEKVFETPQSLQEHSSMEQHSQVASASFMCKFCSQKFFDEKIFGEHQEAHNDPNFRPFKCPHCVIQFNNKDDTLKHIAAFHRVRGMKAHKCKICLKSYNDLNKLNDHNRRAHTGERPFKCKFPNCSYTFHSKEAQPLHYRSKHMKELELEPEQFLCPICGKVFRERIILTRHLKLSHTQDKPYKCTHEGCAKAFKTGTQLTEHVRDHTGEKPHVCEECGQAFARKWSFNKHQRSHAGTLNRAQCHLCPRKFLGGWELKQHLKIHEEKKQFKCQFCQVECATQSYLKKHEKIHGNERASNSEDGSKSSADSDA